MISFFLCAYWTPATSISSRGCALVLAILVSSSTQALAQEKADNAVLVAEISELKAQMKEQQRQIEQLRSLIEKRLLVDTAVPTPIQSPSQVECGKPCSLGNITSATPMVPAALPSTPLPIPPKPAPAQKSPHEHLSPLQIPIGSATITPVGFMDLTNTWRSSNSGASLATNFGNYPYNNTVQSRLSEDRLTAQNSRIGFRVDAKMKSTQILGYYEGDFIGGNAGLNTQVSTNSMTYRLRLFWVNLRKGKWEMQAGQSWSLLDANRNGLSALPNDIFYGAVVDINYLNGLILGRSPDIRLIVHPTSKVTAGISLSNAEQYIGGSGGGGTPTLPAALATSNFFNEVNNGNTNTSVPNLHPDIIAKIAFEPASWVHFEISGVERTFKTFMPSTQAYFTKIGGGVGVNANVEVVKNVRLIINNFWSDGGGRYLFGVAPDMVIRADGSPSLVHAGSTVDGFEAVVKRLQIYGYYGGVFIARNTALDTNKSLIGYGYSGSPDSHNRTTQELTAGLNQTVWQDPRYGGLFFMLQYAYFVRNPWFLAPNSPRNAHETAVWFNLRYTLPGAPPNVKY